MDRIKISNSMKKIALVMSLIVIQLMQGQPICVFIEGLTGAGKTTFLELLKKNIPEIAIMREPVDEYCDVQGTGNILELYFKDLSRWGLAAILYCNATCTKSVEHCIRLATSPLIIFDRSPQTGMYAFAYATHRLGSLTDLELAIARQVCSVLWNSLTIKPAGYIYLRCSPETAMNRIRQRGRVEEASLSMEFEKTLHYFHENWLIYKKGIAQEYVNIPVLVIDAEQNFKDDAEAQHSFVQQVREFIGQLSEKQIDT